jgi:hypothetical protein
MGAIFSNVIPNMLNDSCGNLIQIVQLARYPTS